MATTGGFAIFQAANNLAVMAGIGASHRELVSGMLNLSRNLGLVTGASAMGAVFDLGTTDIAHASLFSVVTGTHGGAFALAAADSRGAAPGNGLGGRRQVSRILWRPRQQMDKMINPQKGDGTFAGDLRTRRHRRHFHRREAQMRVPIFQVDAFTTRRLGGNPAAVMVLDRFADDELMQAIAAENNLSETAFLVPAGGEYRLRWFTPLVEVPLCGHATLASAAVVMERLEPSRRHVTFDSASGPLKVIRTGAGYRMDFPSRRAAPVPVPPGLIRALGEQPIEVQADPFNYIVLLESASRVRELMPDLGALAGLDRTGVVVTAAGEAPYDFTSRYFAPAKGIPEDPVTGGAHCGLAPYWAARLGKRSFLAFQASRRGGELVCRVVGDRVELEGSCVFYMEGSAEI
jgi:predicted PhzF superfamily epimerase YddE/YHI9